MNIKDPRHDLPIWHSGCAALMCIGFAALLVEACNIQLRASPGLHLASTLALLAQAAAIHRSLRPYRAGAAPMSGATSKGKPSRRAEIASALALAAAGAAGAAWLRSGWALAAALLAILLCLIPWSRIPLCRYKPPLAGAMILLGAAALLWIAPPARSPLQLLMPAWVLWLAAGGAWLRLILLKQRKSRTLAGYPASG